MTSFLENIFLVAVSLFVILVSIGAGRWFWKVVGIKNYQWTLPAWFFVGQVLISVVATFVNILLSKPANLIILGLISLFWVRPGLDALRAFKLPDFKKYKKTEFILIAILLTFLIVTFFHSFFWPSEWDEISYHHPVLEEMSQGKVKFPLLSLSPYNDFYKPFSTFYGNLPYASEAYSSVVYLFSLGHRASAHIILFANFVLFLIFWSSFLGSERRLQLTTRLIISVVLATSYGIVITLSTGLVDVSMMIYQLLSVLLLLKSIEDKEYSLIMPSMLFLGYSAGHKYTSLYIIPSYAAIVLIELIGAKLSHHKLKYSFSGFALLILGGGFWYLKNIFIYGNPFYPLYLGHPGVSGEEYSFLVDSLISGLRIEPSLPNLISTLGENYMSEVGTVTAFYLSLIAILLGVLKLSKRVIYLIFIAASTYLINFYFGSQLSRYVLVAPVIFYLLLAEVIQKRKVAALLVFFAVLISVRANALQWSIWSSRLDNIVLMVRGDSQALLDKNVGCANATVSYIKNNSKGPKSALNLWDPYALVFFQKDNIFLRLRNKDDYDDFRPPASTEYLYVNWQYQKEFLENSYLHRDINPEKRAAFQDELIENANLVFSKDNCLLYSLK